MELHVNAALSLNGRRRRNSITHLPRHEVVQRAADVVEVIDGLHFAIGGRGLRENREVVRQRLRQICLVLRPTARPAPPPYLRRDSRLTRRCSRTT